MPKENIERAVKKGTGELEGVDYQEVTYEGYGPGGVALLIDAVTDNPTRTVADVRSKMSRARRQPRHAELGGVDVREEGPDRTSTRRSIDEDALMEAALDAGAEDVQREDEQFHRHDEPERLPRRAERRSKAKGIDVAEAELAMVPKNTVQVAGKDAESLFKLLEAIEELDDVQKVWANFDIDVAEMASRRS